MNNAKASNAILSVADAMANMAADYEQQIAGLKQSNDALLARLITLQSHSTETDGVLGRVDAILSETLKTPEGRQQFSLQSLAQEPEKACRFLQEELRRAPCLKSVGSNGLPPTSLTSKVSTPSG